MSKHTTKKNRSRSKRNNYKELRQSKEGITPGSEVIFSYKGDEIKVRFLRFIVNGHVV